jgi:glycosyltransferase involved in cell wall biosynthesis
MWRVEARRLAAYECSLVRRFSATTVCTGSEERLLRSMTRNGNIRVIENYVDVEQYDPTKIHLSGNIRSWRPYIVFSGSMDYLPNVDAVGYFHREVFPAIRKSSPETRFVIAGRNPHPSIRNLESDPSVVVTGNVPDMKPYLRGAAVAVAPLRIARGVQNKVLEALAIGVPVVCSSAAASALPESLQRLITVADTSRDFADAVLRSLKENPCAASARRRAGLKQYIDGLSLESRFEELFRNPSSDFCRGKPVQASVRVQTA